MFLGVVVTLFTIETCFSAFDVTEFCVSTSIAFWVIDYLVDS